MKKIAVILCVLLSLSVFVSCQEPETDPGKQDDAYVSVMFDPTTVELEGQLKWIDFKVLDLPAEKGITPGKDWIEVKGPGPVELCRIKAGALKELSYEMKLYDKDAVLLGSASGRCAIGTEATLDITTTLKFEKDRRIEIRVKDPASPELAGYSLLWNGVDISDDLIYLSGTGDTLLHSFIYDGTDDFTYTLLPYSEGASLPGDVNGTVHIEKGVDVYYLTPPVIEMQDIVIKVRNSDLPKGSKSINIDALIFEKDYSKSWDIEVSEGDFTLIPLTDEFLEVFKVCEMAEFRCSGIIPDSYVGKDDMFITKISYQAGISEYIVEKPVPVTITLKVANSNYIQPITGYRWHTDYDPDFLYVPKSEGEYTVLGTMDINPMYSEVYIVLEVLGKDNVVISSNWVGINLEQGKTEYVVDKPVEEFNGTIEVAEQEYMLPVSEYGFTFRGEYIGGIIPSDSGNTALFTAFNLKEGEEYEVTVYNKVYGEYTVIGDGTGKIHFTEDSHNVVIDPPVVRGAMRMDCQPTFRTDMVTWSFQKKDAEGTWAEYPGSYSWNPEWPQKDMIYLEPGVYKIVNLYSDEHANGSDQGAWGLTLPDQEINITSGETTVVESQFLGYPRMRVKFRVKTTFEYVGAVKLGIRIEFNDKTYCDCQAYSQVTGHFDYDSDTKEISYTWWGIPTDTDRFYLTLYLGGSKHKGQQFTLEDMKSGEIYWDSTK